MDQSNDRILMLPMAEIPWFEPNQFQDKWPSPPPAPPWTIPWCRAQQMRALEQGHAFYEGRYDYDGNVAPTLVVGTAPMCPGCGVELSCAEAVHAFARTAFAAAQHAPTFPYTLTFDLYSPTCGCGVSSMWELRWRNYGSAHDLRWRLQSHDTQPRTASPDSKLTVAVAVRSATRHHKAHGNVVHDDGDDLPF